ncbi:MAG: Aldehyde ferredoxin oxidoreductase [Clostridiales bacterium]|nr:Aldehyde ferredoxin oxidoreductase [Clostridiales bacterium]
MEKILRINLNTRKIQYEKTDQEMLFFWGRGLIAALLMKEVKPTCEPLGRHNRLIFSRGPLAGTPVPCSGRLSVGGKSPLTGGIKEANAGGNLGHCLGKLGIKAVIVEDKVPNDELYVLFINKDGANLEKVPELRGLSTGETVKELQQRYGEKISAAVIGRGGEMGLAAAGVAVTDMEARPSRFAGRGGLGAVMGSKGLKAVVVDDTGVQMPKPVDKDAFKEANRKLVKILQEHPQTSEVYTEYSTAAALAVVNALGALPTRNFKQGSFEQADNINGDTLHDLILDRGGAGQVSHACMPGCIIRCSNVFPAKDGSELVAPLEYETLGLMGSNLGIGNLDDIALINAKCNDLGLDTIETGATLGLFMEAGIIPFGDVQGVLNLLDEVEKGSVMGRVVGSGALIAGKVLGLSRIPVVKGQAMAAYDPRGIKGNGVTYATSPMGADHTAGNTLRAKVNHLEPRTQAKISETNQVNMAGVDNLGQCMMVVPALGGSFQIFIELLNAFYGWRLDSDFVSKMGRQVIKFEREFNRLAGLTEADDKLPEFVYEEPLEPHNSVFDVQEEDIRGILRF